MGLEVRVPSGATTGKITVEVGGQVGTSADDFVVTPTTVPSITSFTPKSGVVGAEVIISGNNFGSQTSDNIVKFNGIVATVDLVTPMGLHVRVPSGATTGKITVEVGGQIATSTKDFTVNATAPAPSITDFTPKSGEVGTLVTINGKNLGFQVNGNIVKFNGVVARINSIRPTELLTVRVPSGATTGKITVEVGGQIATSVEDFVVTPPTAPSITNFTPKSGEVGTKVIIMGDHFGFEPGDNIVKFNGVAATVDLVSPMGLEVRVPSGATTGKITVEVGGQIATSTEDFTVDIATNIADQLSEGKLVLYPNPITDLLQVQLDGRSVSKITITVLNSQGLSLNTSEYDLVNGRAILNLESLAAGIYYLRIQVDKEQIIKAVIKY